MMLAIDYLLKTNKKRKGYLVIQLFVSLIIIASVIFYNSNMNNLFILLSMGLIYNFFFIGSMTNNVGFKKKRNQLLIMPTKRTSIYDSVYLVEVFNMIFLVFLSLVISITLNLIFKGNLGLPGIGDFYLVFLNISFLLVIEPAFIVIDFEPENSQVFIFGAIILLLFIYPRLIALLTVGVADFNLLDGVEIAYMKKDMLKRIGWILTMYLFGKFIFIKKDLSN